MGADSSQSTEVERKERVAEKDRGGVKVSWRETMTRRGTNKTRKCGELK